jgi:hypothetical protein
VERLVSYDEWFVRQVEEGLAQIERGEVLENDEVAARMEKLIAERQHAANAGGAAACSARAVSGLGQRRPLVHALALDSGSAYT